jgi:signal transduction histidine kinase
VYYVASEALTNVAKHAQASQVRMTVEVDAGCIVLTIGDDGVGGADASRGSGLIGLQDRVAALGGTLAVHSEPGAGTVLSARIPV